MKAPVSFALGVILFLLGIYAIINGGFTAGIIPFCFGLSLMYLGWKGGKTAAIIFGHVSIVLGCYMVTWGIYIIANSEPTIGGILSRPLFWGFIAIFGGICANYHGFCDCIHRRISLRNNKTDRTKNS
jgi:hypothetical protein